jgi:hypothetical protein
MVRIVKVTQSSGTIRKALQHMEKPGTPGVNA